MTRDNSVLNAQASLVATAYANLPAALAKLDPRHLVRQPVIFVVAIGSVLTPVGCSPTAPRKPSLDRICGSATSLWSKLDRSFLAMATLSRAWRRWTSPPLPASRLRSCGSLAETAAR